MTKPPLTLEVLLQEAAAFAEVESKYDEPSLFGVTESLIQNYRDRFHALAIRRTKS